MPTSHSTPVSKPSKPYPDFPLFRHASGQWSKKIRGKLHYFGKDPDRALARYLAEGDDLRAGRTPRPFDGVATIKILCNEFLNLKRDRVEAGELSPLTFVDYKRAADLVIQHFGKNRAIEDVRPDDFTSLRTALSKRYGPRALTKAIQSVRSIFKFAFENRIIDRPVVFGSGFARPSAKNIRLHRAAQGPRLFDREEILRMIECAGTQLKAMILLGINCGFGNSDCANLEYRHIDLERGIVDFPRPKTGIPRRCTLWPETVAAIRAAIDARPRHKNESDANKVFITIHGLSWGRGVNGPVTREIAKLLKRLGIVRRGISFYALRHVYRTVADEVKDQPAVDYTMGHESGHMSTIYRQRISDARLATVANYVHMWLFGKEGGA